MDDLFNNSNLHNDPEPQDVHDAGDAGTEKIPEGVSAETVQKEGNPTVESTAHTSEKKTEPQSAEGTDTAAQGDAASQKQQESSTTYSWVNPKLSGGQANREQQNANNPWNSQSGGNYWQYNSQQNQSQGQTQNQSQYGGYGNSYQQNSYQQNANQQNAYQGNYGAQDSGRKSRKAMHKSRTSGPKTAGGRWSLLIAMALVFGLVAGMTMYGVNYAANSIRPVPSAETAPERIENTKEAAQADSEEKASKEKASDVDSGNTGLSVAKVAKDTMPSLVTISTMSVQEMRSFFGGTQEYTVEGAGTGVIIGQNDAELLIATNNHVIEGATQVSVGFIDESAISANIKGTDVDNDLAVIAVKLEDIPQETQDQIKVAAVGDSDALVLGEQVVAIGNALGYGQSVTSGYVSGLDRSLSFSDGTNRFTSDGLIQTDAAINSGNSGGALLNMNGELIGINEAKSSMTSSGATVDNVGYAIPMAKAMPILENLMNEETREAVDEDKKGYLGVTCADVSEEYSELYNTPVGICFTSVVDGGPAAEAGALKGDVLVKFDGKSVSTFKSLESTLKYYKAGESVDIVIMRADNGKYVEKTLTVTLGTKEVIAGLSQNAQQNTESSSEDAEAEPFEDPEDTQPLPETEPDENDLFGQLFGQD